MKILVLGLFLLITAQGFAQEILVDDIYRSIDEMVKSKIISEVEGQKTKIRLKSGNKEFLQTTNRMPASVQSQLIDSQHGRDLSKVQMRQIEKEIDIIFKKDIN